MDIKGLIIPLAKAEYLLEYTTDAGEGGDKRKFWWTVMGFRSPETLRDAIVAVVSVETLQFQRQDEYGRRYKAVVSVTGPSGASSQIRTVWIVRPDEDVARFVTAFPEKSR